MDIKKILSEGYATLKPHGELDANSSVYLDEHIRSVLSQDYVNIHIDASEVPYMSSAGLGVFISYLEQLKEQNGKFVISHLSPTVKEVFVTLGLNKLDNLIIVEDTQKINYYFEH